MIKMSKFFMITGLLAISQSQAMSGLFKNPRSTHFAHGNAFHNHLARHEFTEAEKMINSGQAEADCEELMRFCEHGRIASFLKKHGALKDCIGHADIYLARIAKITSTNDDDVYSNYWIRDNERIALYNLAQEMIAKGARFDKTDPKYHLSLAPFTSHIVTRTLFRTINRFR